MGWFAPKLKRHRVHDAHVSLFTPREMQQAHPTYVRFIVTPWPHTQTGPRHAASEIDPRPLKDSQGRFRKTHLQAHPEPGMTYEPIPTWWHQE